MPKYYVQIARFERHVQTLVVESTSLEYLKLNLSEVYDTATLTHFDKWQVSHDHLVLEGTHTVLSEVTSDYEINAEDVEVDLVIECEHKQTILDNDSKRFCLECYEII